MNLGENIFNAFDVAASTYDNVNKLIEYCRAMAEEKGEFALPLGSKTLRYRAENFTLGFITLFQSTADELIEHNGWRNGPLYLMDINLYEPAVYDVPMVNIAKFGYANISSWTSGCSQSSYWVFTDPLYIDGYVEYKDEGNRYYGRVINEEEADNQLWGLRTVSGIEIPLTELKSDTAYDIVFGGFHSLAEK